MIDKKADKNEDRVPSEEITTQSREHPVTPEFLEEIYKVRQQVIRDARGELFEDSVEAIRRAREERTQELMGEPAERQHRPITLEAIERLRRVREEILRERNGKFFEDSAALIDEMRDERTRQLMQAATGYYEYDEELDREQC